MTTASIEKTGNGTSYFQVVSLNHNILRSLLSLIVIQLAIVTGEINMLMQQRRPGPLCYCLPLSTSMSRLWVIPSVVNFQSTLVVPCSHTKILFVSPKSTLLYNMDLRPWFHIDRHRPLKRNYFYYFFWSVTGLIFAKYNHGCNVFIVLSIIRHKLFDYSSPLCGQLTYHSHISSYRTGPCI
jgi:hypothetical protein